MLLKTNIIVHRQIATASKYYCTAQMNYQKYPIMEQPLRMATKRESLLYQRFLKHRTLFAKFQSASDNVYSKMKTIFRFTEHTQEG